MSTDIEQLIAEADGWAVKAIWDHPTSAHDTIRRLRNALEREHQRAEGLLRERDFYQRELHTSDDIARRARQRGDVRAQRALDAEAERDALRTAVEDTLSALPGWVRPAEARFIRHILSHALPTPDHTTGDGE